MRKYPKAASSWWSRSNILTFFFAWNAMGFLLYRMYKKRSNESNENLKDATFLQRYLTTLYGEDYGKKFFHVKVKGVNLETETTSLGELVKPSQKVEGEEIIQTATETCIPAGQE